MDLSSKTLTPRTWETPQAIALDLAATHGSNSPNADAFNTSNTAFGNNTPGPS